MSRSTSTRRPSGRTAARKAARHPASKQPGASAPARKAKPARTPAGGLPPAVPAAPGDPRPGETKKQWLARLLVDHKEIVQAEKARIAAAQPKYSTLEQRLRVTRDGKFLRFVNSGGTLVGSAAYCNASAILDGRPERFEPDPLIQLPSPVWHDAFLHLAEFWERNQTCSPAEFAAEAKRLAKAARAAVSDAAKAAPSAETTAAA